MRDLSSPTRDGTRAPCSGSTESQPLDCQGSPHMYFLIVVMANNKFCEITFFFFSYLYWLKVKLFFLIYFYWLIDWLIAIFGLRFCARVFSSCGKRGPLLIAVRGPLTIVASLVAEHRLQTHRLSSCGSRAQLLRGMWDPPRPGLEPVSPALAGIFSTTVPPGKPSPSFLLFLSPFFQPEGKVP